MAALDSPPNDWDGVYHDALALSLSTGNGFRPELDARFRAPYSAPAILDGSYNIELAARGIESFTTYRPPLHPVVLAMIYKLFGRNFIAPKITFALLYALGVAGVVALLALSKGSLVAGVGGALFLLDPFPAVFVSGFHSELLAFFFVVFLLRLLVTWKSPASQRRWIELGVLLGLLAISRTIFVFWSAPLLVWLIWREVQANGVRSAFRGAALSIGMFSIFALPWIIRNVQLLDSFLPLGSQGPMMTGMIYNDRALENDGNWTLEEDGRFIREFQSPLAGTAREAALALHGLSQARSWLLSHREQLPLLIFKRLLSLWWPHSRPDQRIVIVLAFAGLLILGMPDALACACLALIISHSLAIALTSNDPNGRLLYAVQPALLCLAAVAIGDVSTRLSQALIARR